MDALFFGRMDYQDFNVRKVSRDLEWLWQGSQSLPEARVFTGQLYGGGTGGYGAPHFGGLLSPDWNTAGAAPIVSDARLKDVNLEEWVDAAVKAAQEQAQHFRGGHILWAMGSDFNYQDANNWYRNMDQLITGMNKDGRVKAVYSTPRVYVDAKFKAQQEQGIEWDLRSDDIFPLGNAPHAYWSGYFSSRMALKKQERLASSFLQSARQIEMSNAPGAGLHSTALEAAVGLTTHHDGLSGTEKQVLYEIYLWTLAVDSLSKSLLLSTEK